MTHGYSLTELQMVLRNTEKELPNLWKIGERIVAALKGGSKVLTCGNGGSATHASHMAEELTGRFKSNRVALPVTVHSPG